MGSCYYSVYLLLHGHVRSGVRFITDRVSAGEALV